MKQADIVVIGCGFLGLCCAILAARSKRKVILFYTDRVPMASTYNQAWLPSGQFYYPYSKLAEEIDFNQNDMLKFLGLYPEEYPEYYQKGIIKIKSDQEFLEREKWSKKYRLQRIERLDAKKAIERLGVFYDSNYTYISTADRSIPAEKLLDKLMWLASFWNVQFKKVKEPLKLEVTKNQKVIIDYEGGYEAKGIMVCAGIGTPKLIENLSIEKKNPRKSIGIYQSLMGSIPDEASLKVNFFLDSTSGFSLLRHNKMPNQNCLVISDNKEKLVTGKINIFSQKISAAEKNSLLENLPRPLSTLNELKQEFAFGYSLGASSTIFSTHRPCVYKPSTYKNIIIGVPGRISLSLVKAKEMLTKLLGDDMDLSYHLPISTQWRDFLNYCMWYQKNVA